MKRIDIIDSHTGGEPTRVICAGGPELGNGSIAERLHVFRSQHDNFRRAVVNEPRGSDVLVGALLVEPNDKSCVTGVIYFDNVTTISMCGHGTIGVITTLAHLGRIQPGEHFIETSVGVVSARLHADYSVSLTNIPAFRKARAQTFHVPTYGQVTGDVAWGGNWFFLVDEHRQNLALDNVEALTHFAWALRLAVNSQGYPDVDHVILFGPARSADADSQNFVLCPGKAYDRSPCGTGTSARLACLAADGKLAEGAPLVIESIVGSRFVGRYQWEDATRTRIIPNITGTAHVTGQGVLFLNPKDPFCYGICA